MEIYLNKQTAIAAVPFGMSACGRAFDTTPGGFSAWGVDFETRDRVATTQGAMGLAVAAHIPGTSAWSPPVS